MNVNSADATQDTPLFHAIAMGEEDSIENLLTENDLHAEARDRDGFDALSLAASIPRKHVFRMLLKDGRFSLGAGDIDGRTPLSHAAERGLWINVIQLLLSSGVEVDCRDRLGRTPLSYAAESGRYFVVLLLLRTGNVDCCSADNSGRTPVSYAAEQGETQIVRRLLLQLLGTEESHAVVNLKDNNGRTPLHHAVERGHHMSAKSMIDLGADINVRDKDGRTPLSFAAKVHPYVDTGESEPMGERPCFPDDPNVTSCMSLLCKYVDIEIDAADSKGRTPLFYAVLCDDHRSIRDLLKTGESDLDRVDLDAACATNEARQLLAAYRAGRNGLPNWAVDLPVPFMSPQTSPKPIIDRAVRVHDELQPSA